MTKFKVGDRVKRIESDYNGMEIGNESIVISVNREGDIELKDFDGTHTSNYFRKIGSGVVKKPKFLLQYERDEDPIEEFQTLVAVKERIAELTKDDEVQQDSYKVYKIEKVYEVNITKQVNLT